jgi:hypothetical protein
MTEKTDKNRPDHLFKPGQSGNPNGRPKGSGISITTAIKNELKKIPPGQDKATYLDLLVKRIMKKAIQEGDQQTIKQMWNYVDGMPMQTTDITTNGKEITTVQAFNYVNPNTNNSTDTETTPSLEETPRQEN